ncbi:MAG: DUF6345 domain-containing protein [Oscillospiraceae bacterium]|jgi:hypothetical protein|nr:DUF6345 domain-containing protein [Oscillospiraceae bacterium]
MKCKRMVIAMLVTILFVSFCAAPAYGFTAGFAGVDTYSSSSGSCQFGDRAGGHYVDQLYSELWQSAYYLSTNHFGHKNAAANKNVFSSSWSERVTFFAYAGHGLNIDSLNNAAHFFATPTPSSHSGNCYSNAATNATTSEVRLQGSLRYLNMYTCNFLFYDSTAKLNSLRSMFRGGRAICGFASTMYLDSREGADFGRTLTTFENGVPKTIKEAFFESTSRWQPRTGRVRVTARWMGFVDAKNDSLVFPGGAVTAGRWGNVSPSDYVYENRFYN